MPEKEKSRGSRGNHSAKLSNQEIVTIAVFIASQGSHRVETEDVAMEANRLAPGRFTWRKYKDQIDLEAVRKRLWDARRPDKGGFLVGSNREGWSLTQKGLIFARNAAGSLNGLNLHRDRTSLKETQWLAAERRRLLATDAFRKYRSGGAEAVAVSDAEHFFRLDEYATGPERERRIVRLVGAFSDDRRLGKAVHQLAAKIRQE
jgi:hypothetical protein